MASCRPGADFGPPKRSCYERPDSLEVFRMFTFLNSADGHPCDTAAICPGCAFPQLKAPPRTYVCGPPIAAMEPQNCVVLP